MIRWTGLEQIQKELKTVGIKIHDSSKQASDAVDTLAKFPCLRPSMGVMQGASRKISLHAIHVWCLPVLREREFFIDNLLVRIHFIIEMIRWTGLAPWS